jgi:hypothetical protein
MAVRIVPVIPAGLVPFVFVRLLFILTSFGHPRKETTDEHFKSGTDLLALLLYYWHRQFDQRKVQRIWREVKWVAGSL